MGNIQMAQTAPAVIAPPDATYYALFIADGTSGTTAGSLYSKDNSGTVTALTFSGEQAQDAIGNILTASSTVTWTYDDAGNTIAANVVAEGIQDIVGAFFTDSSTLDVTYDDAGNAVSAEFRIQFAGLVTAASKTYLAADRGKYYQRINGGSAMTDTLPTLTAADNGWTLKVANMGTAAAETLTFTAPFGTFTGGASTYVLNFGCRQTFVWTGSNWVFDAGNGNIIKISGSPVVSGNLPSFGDTTGRNVVDSGVAVGAIIPATRTIATTAPLTGGGDLSANRTLALTTSPAGQTPVGTTRSIATTAPLTGGGDLSNDRTLALTTSPAGQTPVGVTRNIATTAPITGGGTLAGDLTLALTTSPAGQTPVGVTRQINTTAPMAGGGALSGDLTLSVPNATQTIAGLQAAADKKKLDLTYYDIVAQGGADPTGAVDCASIITAALATFTNAGVIYFPVGTYKLSSTITVNKEVVFRGASRQRSIIELSSATANGFDVTSNYVGFENLRISTTASSATLRTAGAAINLDNGVAFPGNISNCWVVGVDILFQWKSIILGAHTSWISNCNLREGGANAANGAHIEVQKFGDRYIDRITSDQPANQTGFAGIRVLETSSLVINACNLVHCTTVLSLETQTGKNIPSVEVVNTFFDTSVTGFSINPTGTGTVYRCKFTNCWFSSMTGNGVTMTGTQWDGITFVNCDFYGNVIGISCPSGGGNWSVQGSRFAGNTGSAINVTASAAHNPQIIGNHIGPVSAFGVNGTGIIVAAGTYKGLVVANNNVINNTTNATLGAVTVAAGEAGWYRIIDNAGINPLTGAAVTTPAVPASTVAATNTTGRRVLVLVKNGSTAPTVFTVNGVVLTGFVTVTVTTGINYFILDPGGTIAFTYTVAPTWLWIGN